MPPRKTRAKDVARALRIRLEMEQQAGVEFVRRPKSPPDRPPAPARPRPATATAATPSAQPADGSARPAPPTPAPRVPAAPSSEAGKALAALALQASDCSRCPLHEKRTQVVFGVGNPDSPLIFVGEAPGFDEDRLGEPFVGRAGKLLDRLLGEVGIRRAEVYITNTVKCRPPENRVPAPAEILTCAHWLDQQFRIMKPRLLVTLGNVPTKALLRTETGIMKLRGKKTALGEWIVLPTFHPAYVLRNMGELPKSQEDFRLIADEFKAIR